MVVRRENSESGRWISQAGGYADEGGKGDGAQTASRPLGSPYIPSSDVGSYRMNAQAWRIAALRAKDDSGDLIRMQVRLVLPI